MKPCVVERVLSVWRHRTGLVSWALSRSGQSDPRLWAAASTLAITVPSGLRNSVRSMALVSRSRAGAMNGRVERAADLQGHDPLGAELAGYARGQLDGLGSAGDDRLAGGVVVGQPHLAGGAVAGDQHIVVIEAQNGRHGALALLGRSLHGVAPLGHQRHRVAEVEHARRGQRRVLAEAVAGVAGGLGAEPGHRVEHDHGHDERGELAVAGLGQLLGAGGEKQAGDVPVGGCSRPLPPAPTRVIGPGFAHGGLLGPLSRIHEDDHRWIPLTAKLDPPMLWAGSRSDSARPGRVS